jgi:hypothetical protein
MRLRHISAAEQRPWQADAQGIGFVPWLSDVSRHETSAELAVQFGAARIVSAWAAATLQIRPSVTLPPYSNVSEGEGHAVVTACIGPEPVYRSMRF